MKREAMLWEPMDEQKVHCFLCSHECRIAESKFGVCGVRRNEGGTLFTMAYGEVIAANIDPIEKKPLYHYLPGSRSYSIATFGCNFKCPFCQNWQISQTSWRSGTATGGRRLAPEEIVAEAKNHGCRSISYTYTEPTIFFEYSYDIAMRAKDSGMGNVFVTNGFMTRQTLDTIKPYLAAANVDLKSFRDSYYREYCKARLQPVLDSIVYMRQLGIWVEVTTLVIPGENDSEGELEEIAGFLARTDKDIPWHISRFHPDYRFTDHRPTPLETMRKAREVGWEQGLRYVYLGNVLEEVNTRCYKCNEQVVTREYMAARELNLKDGRCPKCGTEIGGVWH